MSCVVFKEHFILINLNTTTLVAFYCHFYNFKVFETFFFFWKGAEIYW